MRVVVQARRSWNSNIMGWRPATGHETFPTQILQPVHLQLLLIRGKLPEPACPRWFGGVECFECGSSCLAAWRVGGQNVYHSVIRAIRNCDVHRYTYGRLVFPNRDICILFASDRVVCLCCILHERFGVLILHCD